MTLEHLLTQKRIAILEQWFESILETYPTVTARFLKQEKGSFSNPVGTTIYREIGTIYDGLLSQGINPDELSKSLDNIIRIRSVQDFSPSQAIVFIFLLKEVVRETLANEIKEKHVLEEVLQFESRIDRIALLAFDTYMQCREKVCEIRINEIKAEREQALKLLQRISTT